MTTYNGERYLRQQLDSILGQTVAPDEIVICDDGSTDGTRELLERYRERHPGLIKTRLNEKNLGYVKNFYQAIALCSGDLIALSDQDDVWLEDKLERMRDAVGESLLVYADSLFVDSSGNSLGRRESSYFRGKEIPTFKSLLINNFICGHSCLLRKELVAGVSRFPQHIPHDHFFALLALSRNKLAYLDQVLVLYRQHTANTVGGALSTKKKTLASHLREVKYLIPRRDATMHMLYQLLEELEQYSPLLTDGDMRLIAEYKDFLGIYESKDRRISFCAQNRYRRYYGDLKGYANQTFFIPFLRLLTAFYVH
jgi:glycosyltransferase involved in cell wall biosynthesis